MSFFSIGDWMGSSRNIPADSTFEMERDFRVSHYIGVPATSSRTSGNIYSAINIEKPDFYTPFRTSLTPNGCYIYKYGLVSVPHLFVVPKSWSPWASDK